MYPGRILAVVSAFLGLILVNGSHFRGGVITWRPENNVPSTGGPLPQVIFDYRVSFRRSYGTGNHFCNKQTISSGKVNPGEGLLECDTGCSTLRDSLDYNCTDFSVAGDWTTGLGRSIFNPTSTSFNVKYQGGNWIRLVNGGNGRWIIRSKVDLTPRPDNGRINSSPTTATLPIVRVRLNCPVRLAIPVTDPDGDTVRCRHASQQKDECGSVCKSFKSVIHEDSCVVEWMPTRAGLYGAAIQIEDFINPSSRTPLSSIPLQFLFMVERGTGGCNQIPTFAPIVLPGRSCIAVPTNGTFTTRIEAVVSNSQKSIESIDTVSPIGLAVSPVQPVPGKKGNYYVNVTFSSNDVKQMQNIFCFAAEDNEGYMSEQRCIYLVTATEPPTPTSLTYDTATNILTIEVAGNQLLTPTSSRIITIKDRSSQQNFSIDTSRNDTVTVSASGDALLIQLPNALTVGKTYDVIIERGALKANESCGIENEPANYTIVVQLPTTPAPPGGNCPNDINVVLNATETRAYVQWTIPRAPPGATLVTGPSVTRGYFPAGTNTTIRYIFLSSKNGYKLCQFDIVVTAPGVNPNVCPQNLLVETLRGTGGAIVTWNEPARPRSIIRAPVTSGAFIPTGKSCISYTYNNTFGVVEYCSFYVEVVEVSPCDKRPCMNGGSCIATNLTTFQCLCESGCSTGQFCEIGTHACASDPCLNGGTCQLVDGSCLMYTCQCPHCYTGLTCNTTVDPCANNLCSNNSKCVTKKGACGSYTCECTGCTFGAFCEFEIPDPCQSNSCPSGYTCVQNINNCYGFFCEPSKANPSSVTGGVAIPVDDKCLGTPCKNSGVCVPTEFPGGMSGFTCLCPEGYGGYRCAESIDKNPQVQSCAPNPCLNNATCFNSYSSYSGQTSQNEYTCICDGGFTGTNCVNAAGECSPCGAYASSPCLNGGSCRDISISGGNDLNFFCECATGFTGPRCETRATSPCASEPCKNGGTCLLKHFALLFQCICAPGFHGLTCEGQTANKTQPPPVISNCPSPIFKRSSTPVSVQWTMPTAVDVNNNPASLVHANSAPGAVYKPGHFQDVELIFEDSTGSQATCKFWIYVAAK